MLIVYLLIYLFSQGGLLNIFPSLLPQVLGWSEVGHVIKVYQKRVFSNDVIKKLLPENFDILLHRVDETLHRCVSMHACTHTHTHARMHAHTHTHTRMHTYTRTHAHKHAHTHTHMHTHTRKHAHIHMHARTHARTHGRTHTRTHGRTHTRTHAHSKPSETSACVWLAVLFPGFRLRFRNTQKRSNGLRRKSRRWTPVCLPA